MLACGMCWAGAKTGYKLLSPPCKWLWIGPSLAALEWLLSGEARTVGGTGIKTAWPSQRKVTGGSAAGWGYGQDQSTSAEWALAPSCDLWPASAPKAQILLTIASCSTWITLVFKHQQALRQTTGDVADTRETGDRQLARGTRGRAQVSGQNIESGGET